MPYLVRLVDRVADAVLNLALPHLDDDVGRRDEVDP
jgi:hypothetical protein